MTSITIYLDRAILGRCIVCEKRLGNLSMWVGSSTVMEWEQDQRRLQPRRRDARLLRGVFGTVRGWGEGARMTLRLAPRPQQRERIEASEWNALERRLAVARLKDELEPRVRRWKVKRALRRFVEWVGL